MNTKAINILLVEDNMINQFVAKKMMTRWNMNVVIANHGEEALSFIENKSFDLVLMDLEMPVMDGYESTTKIRNMEDAYFKNIPIIAFSASDLDDAQEKAVLSGMNDFVTKPLQQDELQNTIAKYVVTTLGSKPEVRQLNFDINTHTDGDQEFKTELVTLMIADIVELQKSLHDAVASNDPKMFLRGEHKAKTTVSMINDVELKNILLQIKTKMLSANEHSNVNLEGQDWRFNEITQLIVQSLKGLLNS